MSALSFAGYSPFRTALPDYDDEGSYPTVYTKLNGRPAWSNGHFLVMEPVPERVTVSDIHPDFEKVLTNFLGDMQEITPLAFEWDGGMWIVIFSDCLHVLNAKYFDAARLLCPDARFFASAKQTDPVVVKSPSGDLIAIIHGRRHVIGPEVIQLKESR